MDAALKVALEGRLLQVENLRIELQDSGQDIVADISFSLSAGEILGLVGESGSGKTTIASALLGHARTGARITGGSIKVEGIDILGLDHDQLRAWRGKRISYVAQDPATALNPVLRIGNQLHEVLIVHEPALDQLGRQRRVLAMLRDVGLPADPEFLQRFPHQLSGGQQQRILLALAFLLRPSLIVLDEPTTALDVTTQARILATIRSLCGQYGVAAVYVSHDLAVVRHLVDRVIVLYAGRVAEVASREALFAHPAHPYSRGLLAAIPDVAQRRVLQPIPGQAPAPGTRPAGCAFAPRCARRQDDCVHSSPTAIELAPRHTVACFHPVPESEPLLVRDLREAAKGADPQMPLLESKGIDAAYGPKQVLFDVAFGLGRGECLALVGESGSGKTTLARALAGLGEHAEGEVYYDGEPLPLRTRARNNEVRRQIQYVFQNPYRALNPRKTVNQALRTVLDHFFPKIGEQEAQRRVFRALERVALQPQLADAWPRELSGGERQRVAIARALVCEPSLLICDEITSSLDVSVQATILQLLRSLQDDGLSILFVTHDLGVVRAIADRVVVLREGRVVESGTVESVLDRPTAAYTRMLVNDSPSLSA